jgi:hypothetical protein
MGNLDDLRCGRPAREERDSQKAEPETLFEQHHGAPAQGLIGSAPA